MVNFRVIILQTIMMLLIASFFLFTMSISIFVIMAVFAPALPREYAADSMIVALIPSAILTLLFIKKVVGKLYDVIYVIIYHKKPNIKS